MLKFLYSRMQIYSRMEETTQLHFGVNFVPNFVVGSTCRLWIGVACVIQTHAVA